MPIYQKPLCLSNHKHNHYAFALMLNYLLLHTTYSTACVIFNYIKYFQEHYCFKSEHIKNIDTKKNLSISCKNI